MSKSGIEYESEDLLPVSTKFRMGRKDAAPDLAGDIVLWTSYPDDVTGIDNPNEKQVVRVYVEVSWPATMAYAEREKRVFVKEFCNPAILPAEQP